MLVLVENKPEVMAMEIVLPDDHFKFIDMKNILK
jgi:hypothetical protein